jgi:hypothetical protein
MPMDWKKIAERSKELGEQGYSADQVGAIIEQENRGDADDIRRGAESDRSYFNEGPTAQPGEMPRKKLGIAMMDAAYEHQGARVRPSTGATDATCAAAFNVLFSRAAQGDPEAVYKQPHESWPDAKRRYDDARRD